MRSTRHPEVAGTSDLLPRLHRLVRPRLIDNDLIQAAAATYVITATDGEIDAEQAQLEQQAGGAPQLLQQAVLSGIPPSELREALRGLVLSNKLSEAVVANETVTQEQLQAAYQQNIDQFDTV